MTKSDKAGNTMYEIADLNKVYNLCLGAHASALSFLSGKSASVRLLSENPRDWNVEENPLLSRIQQPPAAPLPVHSTAIILPSEAQVLDDFEASLGGICTAEGSLNAKNLTLSISGEARVDLSWASARNILVYAFDNARVSIKRTEAYRLLIMADDESMVEIDDCVCDLVNIRQKGSSEVQVKQTLSCSEENQEPVFGVIGDISRLSIPANTLLLPQSRVKRFWQSMAAKFSGGL